MEIDVQQIITAIQPLLDKVGYYGTGFYHIVYVRELVLASILLILGAILSTFFIYMFIRESDQDSKVIAFLFSLPSVSLCIRGIYSLLTLDYQTITTIISTIKG